MARRMRRDQKSQVGTFLQKRMPCDDCLVFYSGLDALPVEKIAYKKQELAETLSLLVGEQQAEKSLSELFDEAIADEARIRGLGDVVARTLSAVGIRKKRGCGCGKRQAALNRLVPFRK